MATTILDTPMMPFTLTPLSAATGDGFRARFADSADAGGVWLGTATPELAWHTGARWVVMRAPDGCTRAEVTAVVGPRRRRWPKLRRVTLVSEHGGPFVEVPSRADRAAERRARSALARSARRAKRRAA